MRIFLLQHMLVGYGGHWFNETLGFIAAARRADMETRVYAAHNVDSAVARQTGARGVYALTQEIVKRHGVPSRHAGKSPDPHCQPLIDFMAWSEACRQACTAIQQDGIGSNDVLAVPFALIYEVHGIALWLQTLPENRRPGVFLNFGEPHSTWQLADDRDTISGDISFSQYAGSRLRNALPEHRMLLTAPDRRLCAAVQYGLGLQCRLAPITLDYDADGSPDAVRASRAPDDPPTISVVGDFRAERGSEQILDAIRVVATRRPATRFFVQVRRDAEASQLMETLRKDVPGIQVECQVGAVSRKQYLNQLWRSDLVLLPYFWKRYSMRASGVFSEATAYGIPVVAPARTSMADHIEAGRGTGEIFSEWTSASIAEALVRARDRLGELKDQARQRSEAWRQEQSIHALMPALARWWKSWAQ